MSAPMRPEPRLIDAEELARWCEERADEAEADIDETADTLGYSDGKDVAFRTAALRARKLAREARSLARTSPPSGEAGRIVVELTRDEATALFTSESYHGDPHNTALHRRATDKLYQVLHPDREGGEGRG